MEGPILIYGAGSLCRVVESMINDSTNNEIFIFDSNIKLNNLIFSRVFTAEKGTLNIIRNNDNYSWEAINLPLDELEFSTNNEKSASFVFDILHIYVL